MGSDPWWVWLLPILFTIPWIAGIAWICLRSTRDSGEVLPSMADAARHRLWAR
jgi:hypothetical protein